MVALRITKYSPKYRAANGGYMRREWISAGDVGKTFEDGPLTLEKYLATEDAYVEAAQLFLKECDITCMRVVYLEERTVLDTPPGSEEENRQWLKDVQKGREYSEESLGRLIRLNLREVCWTILEGAHGAYLHFGYDYYMYVGAEAEEEKIRGIEFPSLVYVENFESPYHHLDAEDDRTT